MNKKAVEITMNVVIITAILLIVLIVLIFVFTGRVQLFKGGLEDCSVKQGTCKLSNECSGPTFKGTNCEAKDPPEVCCLGI